MAKIIRERNSMLRYTYIVLVDNHSGLADIFDILSLLNVVHEWRIYRFKDMRSHNLFMCEVFTFCS